MALGFLITYCVVGGAFAGLIFVTSVICIPMIMNHKVDAVSAGPTSIRACVQNPGVMLFWGRSGQLHHRAVHGAGFFLDCWWQAR